MSKLNHSGNLILAGFGMAILLMSFLVYKSLQQNFELVTDNYYEKEVLFQGQLNAAENAKPYDSLFAIKKNGDAITLSLPTQLASNLINGSVYFYCPSNRNEDRTFPLDNTANGQYNYNTTDWQKVGYKARVSFKSNGTDYFKELDVYL